MKQPSLLAHLRDVLLLPFNVAVVLPWLLYHWGHPILIPLWLKAIGALLMTGGLVLFGITVILFRRHGKGTLAPWAPTKVLIISGPYRYCRNPMITGVWLILDGEFLISGVPGIGWLALIFFVVNTVYFHFFEEPSMLARFGDAYRNYCKQVPRWIPMTRPFRE